MAAVCGGGADVGDGICVSPAHLVLLSAPVPQASGRWGYSCHLPFCGTETMQQRSLPSRGSQFVIEMDAWAAASGSVGAPQRYSHLESQNVTLFGTMISADVIRVRISQ